MEENCAAFLQFKLSHTLGRQNVGRRGSRLPLRVALTVRFVRARAILAAFASTLHKKEGAITTTFGKREKKIVPLFFFFFAIIFAPIPY
jgi:hypothetical protein